MANYQLDELDEKILKLIIGNARIPFLEVARICNVSGAAIHQRIQRLTALGVIKGSEFIVDNTKVGYDTCAYVGIFLNSPGQFPSVTEALKNVAIKDGDLEIEIDESAEFYIKDTNGTPYVDTILKSEARRVTLFVKTDHDYQELVYRIAYPSYDIGKLVEKINAGRYRMAGTDKGEFTGHIIDVADNGDADAVGE